jgi:hypothetical protein
LQTKHENNLFTSVLQFFYLFLQKKHPKVIKKKLAVFDVFYGFL